MAPSHRKRREHFLWAQSSSVHPYRLGIVPAPQGKHSLRLHTGLVGKNKLPLWGHEIMRLGVDTGLVPTGCQERQPPARVTAYILCTWASNLAVWTHLGIVQRKLVLRAFEDSFTERKKTGCQGS